MGLVNHFDCIEPTINYVLFTIYYLLFTTYLLFTFYYLLFTIYYLLFTICYLLFLLYRACYLLCTYNQVCNTFEIRALCQIGIDSNQIPFLHVFSFGKALLLGPGGPLIEPSMSVCPPVPSAR